MDKYPSIACHHCGGYKGRDGSGRRRCQSCAAADCGCRAGGTDRRIAGAILVAAFTLWTGAVVAQTVSAENEFIPAPDEPCGVACPNPDAPLSRLNYPPADDNFRQKFVPTETGLALVDNPDWAGTDGPWCGILCLDPYSDPSVKNPYRRNDAWSFQILTGEQGGEVTLAFAWNPHWVMPDRLAAIEGIAVASDIEAIVAGASALFPPLGWLDGEVASNAGEPDGDVLLRSADRTNVAYHASGDDVFQPDLLRSIGGVLSQGSVSNDSQNGSPKVHFVVILNGGYPGYVLVTKGAAAGRYPIPYHELVPMALFIDSGGTSLYTLWQEDRLPADFQQAAGFSKYYNGPGFVALEFATTRYADVLHFLDTCMSCEDRSEAAANSSVSADAESGSTRRGSYINTDIGRPYEVRHVDMAPVEISGGIARFHWSRDAAPGGRVSVDRILPIVRPEKMRINAASLLADDLIIHLLMSGNDVVETRLSEEAAIVGQRKLEDAFFLFETLALLRATKLRALEDWSVFMAALSLDSVVRRNREPWQQYRETYCGVYPLATECGGPNATDRQ